MKGGTRKGAGRRPLPPEIKKQAVSIKLPPKLIKWMDAQRESRAILIEKYLPWRQNEIQSIRHEKEKVC